MLCSNPFFALQNGASCIMPLPEGDHVIMSNKIKISHMSRLLQTPRYRRCSGNFGSHWPITIRYLVRHRHHSFPLLSFGARFQSTNCVTRRDFHTDVAPAPTAAHPGDDRPRSPVCAATSSLVCCASKFASTDRYLYIVQFTAFFHVSAGHHHFTVVSIICSSFAQSTPRMRATLLLVLPLLRQPATNHHHHHHHHYPAGTVTHKRAHGEGEAYELTLIFGQSR